MLYETHAREPRPKTHFSRPTRRLFYAQKRNLKRELREVRHLQEHAERMPQVRLARERGATLLMPILRSGYAEKKPAGTYGRAHRARRASLLPHAYGQPCPLCDEPMLQGQALDLHHSTAVSIDPTSIGDQIAHTACNRRRGNLPQKEAEGGVPSL